MRESRNEIRAGLNNPQAEFLALPNKFRAFVAGFGCLRGDSLVVTEFGPMPIQEINRPMRVLSWSEKSNQFELSLSGGAFPKGMGNLYRVETQQGVFVASGHHRVLCADGSYQPVEMLGAGAMVFASSQNLLQTSLGDFPKSLHAGDRRLNQKLEDSMGRYADAARRYGQRLLQPSGIDQSSVQRQADAQELSLCFAHSDDLSAHEQAHIHQGLPCAHNESSGSSLRAALREAVVAHHEFEECFEHAYQSSREIQQSLLTREHHSQEEVFSTSTRREAPAFYAASKSVHIYQCTCRHGFAHNRPAQQLVQALSQVSTEYKQAHQEATFTSSTIKPCNIISVVRLEDIEAYYDLQVLDNNCYVTVDGAIHHNSGKTWVGCSGIAAHFYEWPKVNQGYFAPSYPLIRDIFYPTMSEVAESMGLRAKVKKGDHEVEIYSGSRYRGTVFCRSMDDPANIVGFKIGHALVDELDILAEKKAEQAWRKIIARMRYNVTGLINGIDVTTTPEGFKFVYKQFVKALRDKPELRKNYGLVHASTYDNEINLPDDYIDSLMEAYTPELISAYLRGQFVNLTSGTIYHQFDRKLNDCSDTVQAGEPLFIGMDFNVGKMAAITHVKRDKLPRAVDEITKGYDTPDMILKIKRRYWEETTQNEFRKTCEIRIYPDATGDSRKSVNASATDIQMLKAAGFSVIAPEANPPVKDRINAMNAMFCNARGERRYLVNTDKCPTYTDSLEQQVWADNGEPDKKADNDHPNDAGGYFIHREYPLVKPVTRIDLGFAYR